MNEQNGGANITKNAAVAARASAKAAAGNYAGAAKDVLAGTDAGRAILNILAGLLAVIIILTSMLPSVLFSRFEKKAYNDFHKSTPNAAIYFGGTEEEAKEELSNQIDITLDLIEKWHDHLKFECNEDIAARKLGYVGTDYRFTSSIVDDWSLATNKRYEAIKFMCAYATMYCDNLESVETGEELDVKEPDYTKWLGYNDWSFEVWEAITRSDEGKYKPEGFLTNCEYFRGVFLPFDDPDTEHDHLKETEDRLNNCYDADDFKEYYATFLEKVIHHVEPTITETTETVSTGDGHTKTITYVHAEYNIKLETDLDTIASEICKFPASDDTHIVSDDRTAIFKEMVANTCEVLDISQMSSIMKGLLGFGGGNNIVQVALQEVGTVETPVNVVKYNEWFYGHNVSGSDYAWCAAFVSWCADQCGLIEAGVVPKDAYCPTIRAFYNERGRVISIADWANGSTEFTPQPGDFIIRHEGKHIGIVTKYVDGTLYTVEGNSSSGISAVDNDGGCVAEHMYSDVVTSWGADGCFCRPEYPTVYGATYECKGYRLSNSEKIYVAALIQSEDSDWESGGTAAAASHMANLCEYWWTNGKYTNKKGDLYATVHKNPWWADSDAPEILNATESDVIPEILDIVESVICEGHRTLPQYVTEFGGFSEIYHKYAGQRRYLQIDGQDAPNDKARALELCQNAIPGQSTVKSSFGDGEGIFFCYFSDGINGNVFFYYDWYYNWCERNNDET